MMQQVKHHPIPIISWKNANFSQIVSSIAKNEPAIGDAPHPNFIRNRILPKNQVGRIPYRKSGALPLKIYRRETNANAKGNPRTSVKIDEFNRPQGTLVSSSSTPGECLGTALPMDLQLPNSRSENGTMDCNISNASVCMEDNARRRVRSGGMIRSKSYCTNTNQYLTARNRTFVQNQYNLVRTSESSLLTPETEKVADNKSNLGVFYKNNLFVANGQEQCETAKYRVEEEYSAGVLIPYNNAVHTRFQYYWDTSATPVDVFLPYGEYHLEEFNAVLINTMNANNHYYINKTTETREYLLKFVYNYQLKKIELQAFTFASFNGNSNYTLPSGASWQSGTKTPAVKIFAGSKLQYAVGFIGSDTTPYPSDYQTRTTNYAAASNMQFTLLPRYIYSAITYKPSNYKYANQGAVSSSARILRLQYDTVNSAASSYSGVFGKNVANAMAYRTSENINNFKEKLGYPLTKTPTFTRGEFECKQYQSCNTAEYNK